MKGQSAGSEKNVESVARNLITLIQQHLDGGSSQEGAPGNLSPRAATVFNPPPSTAAVFSPPTRTATSMQTSVSSEMQSIPDDQDNAVTPLPPSTAASTSAAKQVKQLRKGLKETGIWPLLSNRSDVVKLLFPCEKEAEITPQMILTHIKWPTPNPDSDDDENDVSVEAVTQVTTYFRTFIEHASSEHLKNLLQFWVGWEVPPEELIVKVASGHLPRALTCFETIKLPDHHTNYKDFESNLLGAITTCETGFGLV
ncbi:uncharacterized protein LOC115412067 [Sphaeramia orbicularis]|uniref:uncharacterized protein LOC115412067 n=1 Tax=Sphaeramia orbicularis TaxID=375764 RepID=UPI001180F053|nr:uncharacterized protein LOC115412067 [Sphaeramia orbicularis]